MKVLAIATIVKPITQEEKQQIMPKEVPATLKLYLDGKIEQFWARQDQPGVVFVVNAESVDTAKQIIASLPLVAEGVAKYDFIPLGPLAPLGLLIQGK